MRVTALEVPGVRLVEPRVFGDARGYFLETYRAARYREAGIDCRFVQDNLSRSTRGVLRGLHFQEPFAQSKLVSVVAGEIFDVAVDVRPDSPTFGRWTGARLSGDNHHQMFVPAGLAHGFCTLSEVALVSYKCDEIYHPECETTLAWNDPEVGIEWPIEDPVVSGKDAAGVSLAQIAARRG